MQKATFYYRKSPCENCWQHVCDYLTVTLIVENMLLFTFFIGIFEHREGTNLPLKKKCICQICHLLMQAEGDIIKTHVAIRMLKNAL